MKVYFQTYGCSFNQSDSEVMAGLLEKDGHEITDDIEQSDVVVVNSCVVKDATQRELFKFLDACDKKVVVAGCAPSSIPEKLKQYSMVGVDNLQAINEVVDATSNGETLVKTEKEDKERLALPKLRKNPIVEIIPISKGCLGQCTYCLTVNARGKLESYEGRDIKHAAEEAIKDGVKELWLTSQDTACWGMDIKQRLPQLVESLTHIEGDFYIRVGMGNPNWFILILDDLIQVLKHDKVFKFLHIPIQAGDDEILNLMKRGYSANTYKKIVTKLMQEIPEICIATDIICGFPGETEEQFQKTLDIIKETKPLVTNISRYAARPHTPAAEMEQLDPKTLKERSQRVHELFTEVRREELKKFVGQKTTILIDEKGKFPDQSVGRMPNYLPVVIEGTYSLGDKINVEITESDLYHLKGILI